jgi:hypothetical protein
MPYPVFDRSRLSLLPLSRRQHDVTLADCLALDAPVPPLEGEPGALLDAVVARVVAARQHGRPVILMMGAHPIKLGLSRYLIDLLERGLLTHIAMNGACVIHDYELALVGATSESVARYICEGQFGLWQETGGINDSIAAGAADGIGLGEAVGRTLTTDSFPHREISILAAAYRLQVPATVHVGIGHDIIHAHPNCDGAALGATSYHDFLVFAQAITALEGGVVLTIGTAVMGPEVYLKALAMARNVAHQEGRRIAHFTTAVFDLQDLGPDVHAVPSKDAPGYYVRFLKTILVRTVQDGGESFYVRADHRATIPNLHRRLTLAVSPKRLQENKFPRQGQNP